MPSPGLDQPARLDSPADMPGDQISVRGAHSPGRFPSGCAHHYAGMDPEHRFPTGPAASAR
jgi:hypothetical protein